MLTFWPRQAAGTYAIQSLRSQIVTSNLACLTHPAVRSRFVRCSRYRELRPASGDAIMSLNRIGSVCHRLSMADEWPSPLAAARTQ